MLKAFLNTDSGGDGVLKWAETEWEWGVSVKNVIEELSALLNFEIVWSVEGSLVDSAPLVSLLRLSLSTAHEHVQGKDVVNGKLLGLYSLLKGFLVDNNLVAINQVLFELVG